jgi:hypothetical protein
MAQLTHEEYDILERAITDGRRIVIHRRGTEYVVIPRALRLTGGRELIESVHPTTGDDFDFYIDDLESIQVVP